MMHFATLALGLLASVSAHTELSDLYKQYKNGKNSAPLEKTTFRDVHVASSQDKMESPFFPPHAGQSPNDYHPQLRKPLRADEPMTYYSWHLHLYFFHEDKNVTDRALAVRDEFMSTFHLQDCVDDCFMGGPFDTCNTGSCTWDPVYGVDGPHPYGQWGVYITNEMLAETLSWMTMNHGEFEVFFHPNTGYMVGDHDPNKRAVWMKTQVPLDLDFLIWLQCEWFECSDAVTLANLSL
jgi:aromatic ring-cleaving dioxygenase